MTVQSLWEIPSKPETFRTPTTILREQAEILSELTGNMLIGEIRHEEPVLDENLFNVSLYIAAPVLKQYRLKVLEIVHGANPYPVKVADSLNLDKFNEEAGNEDEYLSILKRILSSEKVQRAISILMSESSA